MSVDAERPWSASDAADTRSPSVLVPRQDEPAHADAERLVAAVGALERVRTQLARTQRTLDAFVAQITGTPEGTQMRAPLAPAPEPLPEPTAPARRAPVSSSPSRFDPPAVLADHVLPPAELQPPPAPVVPAAPPASAVEAPPAAAPSEPRPAPPGALSGHVHAPGDPAPEPRAER